MSERATPRRAATTTRGLLVVAAAGVAVRLWHYLRDPDVWLDEAALLINVVLDFHELAGPLLVNEAAPLLFLWLERGLADLAGDGTAVLRLPALVASVWTIVAVTWTARCLLPPAAAVVAVTLVAGSDRLIRHATEAKPYAIDAAVAVTVALVFLRLARRHPARALGVYLVLAPVVIGLSYPAGFVLGGAVLALPPSGRATWPTRLWAMYGALIAVVGVAFTLMVVGPVASQTTSALRAAWDSSFPDPARPWLAPWWTLRQSVGVVDYAFRPLGGC